MALKDDFKELVEKTRGDEKRKRRETLPDSEWWEAIRDIDIKPVLVAAEEALRESGVVGSRQQRKNGGSGIELTAGTPDLTRHLTFTHDTRGIQVTSSEPSLNERWDERKHVTPETVTEKVRDFITLIVPGFLDATGQAWAGTRPFGG